MATGTRTRSRAKAKAYDSKSAEALALMTGQDAEFTGQNLSIKMVEKVMIARGRPMGYAFIYGVAKRNGIALERAHRRPLRAFSKDKSGVMTVQTGSSHHSSVVIYPDGTITAGQVVITPDGEVKKVRAARKATQ